MVGLDGEGNLLVKSLGVPTGYAHHQMTVASPLALDLDPAKWYLYKFYVKVSSYDVDTIRLRLFLSDFQRVVEYNVSHTGGWSGYQFVPPLGKAETVYNVFFAPHQVLSHRSVSHSI